MKYIISVGYCAVLMMDIVDLSIKTFFALFCFNHCVEFVNLSLCIMFHEE